MNKKERAKFCPPFSSLKREGLCDTMLTLLVKISRSSTTEDLSFIHAYLMGWKEHLFGEEAENYTDVQRRLWQATIYMVSGRFPTAVAPSKMED